MIFKLTTYLTTTHKQKIGILAYKDRTIYFEYDKEFLASGMELSPYKLPLREGLHICKDFPLE